MAEFGHMTISIHILHSWILHK